MNRIVIFLRLFLLCLIASFHLSLFAIEPKVIDGQIIFTNYDGSVKTFFLDDVESFETSECKRFTNVRFRDNTGYRKEKVKTSIDLILRSLETERLIDNFIKSRKDCYINKYMFIEGPINRDGQIFILCESKYYRITSNNYKEFKRVFGDKFILDRSCYSNSNRNSPINELKNPEVLKQFDLYTSTTKYSDRQNTLHSSIEIRKYKEVLKLGNLAEQEKLRVEQLLKQARSKIVKPKL